MTNMTQAIKKYWETRVLEKRFAEFEARWEKLDKRSQKTLDEARKTREDSRNFRETYLNPQEKQIETFISNLDECLLKNDIL